MHPTKAELINKNGLRCMLCGKVFSYKYLNWHHIKPKSICKQNKEPIDNSYENSALLCLDCHEYVHTFDYYDNEYQYLMNIIRKNKL